MAYSEFVADLWRAGMVKFNAAPVDLVTPFFVEKKGNTQRLVWDCRAVNLRFKAPPPLAIAFGAAWARLELPPGSQLFVAQRDLQD